MSYINRDTQRDSETQTRYRYRPDMDTDRMSILFWVDFLDKMIKKVEKLVVAIIENIE